MTPQEMADAAHRAIRDGSRMVMVRGKGIPRSFPRGELLCEQHDGRRVYAYDPRKVLSWLNDHCLICIEVAK